MRLKLYRAAAMAEAMALVRAELGEDALILATRRVGDGVEVTAATEPEDEPAPSRADPEVAAALAFHAVPEPLRSALQRGSLATSIAKELAFAALPLNESPLLVVGAPGAGKTLTIARLATRLVIAGVRPMVITTDAQRAGATEQLAAYTRLLGLTLIVACHPVTLGRALTRCRGEPVLVDSAGCDPFAAEQMDEMAALATTIRAAMVAILPAGLDPAEAADQARAFGRLGARLMLPTRLDLARRLGGILTAASTGLALTEAGMGPGAADGLVPLTPEWLAQRLLKGPRA
jgi:flagellar biosynthesis protein FlhF